MEDDDEYGGASGMIGRGKLKYSEKTCPTIAMSTINLALPGFEPGPPPWDKKTNSVAFSPRANYTD
jgi:hypothetical protein